MKLGLLGPGQRAHPNAVVTAVAMLTGKARPPGSVKQSATTKPELAESSGEAGSPWSKAAGTTNTTAVAAVANSANEARPSGFAKDGVTTESETDKEERLVQYASPHGPGACDAIAREVRKEARASFSRNLRLIIFQCVDVVLSICVEGVVGLLFYVVMDAPVLVRRCPCYYGATSPAFVKPS